jgi:hypothetical protein
VFGVVKLKKTCTAFTFSCTTLCKISVQSDCVFHAFHMFALVTALDS